MDSEKRFKNLRLYNGIMGLFHLVQGVAVVALSNDFKLPIFGTFLGGQPSSTPQLIPTELFTVRLGYWVAAFVFLSALAHFLLITPGIYEWYVEGLKKNRNYGRWMEYSISSSLMVMLIALLPGIFDGAALIAIFGANLSMILFGWILEKYEEPGNPDWTAFVFGCITGAFPWLAIALYMWGPGVDAHPPAFVYWIFFVIFAFFMSFAVNMFLQYKKVGPWRDYLFGERMYILLSLVSKSALVWMVFANTLVN